MSPVVYTRPRSADSRADQTGESRHLGSRIRLAFVALGLAVAQLAGGQAQEAERQADAEAGRALAAPCVACHGEDGNSLVPSYPSLAGQNVRYLVRQMIMIRDGTRPAPLMVGQMDAYTDAEIEDMAAFYASQTPAIGQAERENIELGEAIYRGGLLDKRVAACTACHAPDGSGNALAGFPRVSGQQTDYVIDQLRAYREGQRTTDEDYYGMMRQTAVHLTDGEIRAVANYLYGLH